MIKLVAIDLDGTLFDSKKIVTKENKIALKMAREKGIKIVLASGRPYCGIHDLLEELDLITDHDYVICYNGARVFNTLTKESIFESNLKYDDILKIYLESKRQNSFFHAFEESGRLLTSKYNPYTEIESTINKVVAEETDIEKLPLNSKYIKAMIVDNKDNITKIINEINPELPKDYQMVRSSNIFLEFLDNNTNKGYAVSELASYLGYKKEEIMAIGDAGNDIAMIKYAGVGVAMANAFPEVKIVADYITKSDNENSGVAEAINKFCLDK